MGLMVDTLELESWRVEKAGGGHSRYPAKVVRGSQTHAVKRRQDGQGGKGWDHFRTSGREAVGDLGEREIRGAGAQTSTLCTVPELHTASPAVHGTDGT